MIDIGQQESQAVFSRGVGHFRYGPLFACKMLLKAYQDSVSDERKITTAKSVTSSISCAEKYFEDEGTGDEQLRFFWENVIKYEYGPRVLLVVVLLEMIMILKNLFG